MKTVIYRNKLGRIIHSDSLTYMEKKVEDDSINLIMTSPPFALTREKNYGNVGSNEYCEWIRPFISEFKRIIKPNGSIVIDIGASWNKGLPTKSIYQYKFLLMMVEELGLHLIHDYYWLNPSKLPTPAEWVNVRRIRVKDAVNNIFWMAKTPYPKASNRRVLSPYSDSMEKLLIDGYKPRKRPSGHDISNKFQTNNKGAIPPNFLVIPNTSSTNPYIKYCNKNKIKIHDARFPSLVPEYFIRLTTNENDLVLDPFSGSGITGKIANDLNRKWVCIDLEKEFCEGAKGWFGKNRIGSNVNKKKKPLIINTPLTDRNILDNSPLDEDGGKKRSEKRKTK